MDENPFAAPVNPYAAPKSESSADGVQWVTARIIQLLSQTRPWAMLMSILGFLGGILMIVLGLFVGVGAGFGAVSGIGAAESVIFLIYAVFGLLYLIPSYYLFSYSLRIGEFLRDATGERLAAALQAQKSFWKFVGVMTAVIMCLYCLAIPITMAVAMAIGP